MSATDAAEDCRIDSQIMLRQYEKVLSIKNGSLFDIIDIPFNGGEFTFFYRLTDYFRTEDEQAAREVGYHVALLSTLIYLSSKIHFSIAERGQFEEEHRQKKVQFPVLVGDLLYSLFCAEILQGPYQSSLGDYIALLIQFNADMVDYLERKQVLPEVLARHIGALARLTIKILQPAADGGVYQRAQRLGRWVSTLLLINAEEDILPKTDGEKKFRQALVEDSQKAIASWTDLKEYLMTNQVTICKHY